MGGRDEGYFAWWANNPALALREKLQHGGGTVDREDSTTDRRTSKLDEGQTVVLLELDAAVAWRSLPELRAMMDAAKRDARSIAL